MFLGRVVRPGVDPDWTEEDQDKALAYNRARAGVCSSCNTRRELWVGHDRENPPYVGQLDVCPGCEILEQEKHNIPEGTEPYVTAYLTPRHLAEDPKEE